MKIAVIEPDVPSGEKFVSELLKGGFEVKRCAANIAPRVLGDKMNTNPEVEKDFQGIIDSCAIGSETDTMVIACNTLQLWLPKVDSHGLKVMTTFEAVDWYVKESGANPVWLGTWPLVREITERKKYKTLVSEDRTDLQDLVQEMIWRIKGVEGSDVDGATMVEDVRDKEIMVQKGKKLFDEIKKMNLDSVVLGCTELPILVEKYLSGYDFGELELIDPAKIMVKMIRSS